MNHRFTERITYAAPEDPLWKRALIQGIERVSGQRRILRMYQQMVDEQISGIEFWAETLRRMEVTPVYDTQQLAKVPKQGPVIFIANHPFGVLDGLMIGHIVSLIRPEFNILTNRQLCQAEEMAPYVFPIDFGATKEAMRTNIETKQRSIAALNAGGALIIFPAGGVSTAPNAFAPVTDLTWKTFTAKLISMSKATVIPLFFHGHNPRLFQVVSQFSLTLRYAMLLHEVKNKMGKSFKIEIGDPIAYEELAPIKNRQELIQHLRTRVYALGGQEPGVGKDW